MTKTITLTDADGQKFELVPLGNLGVNTTGSFSIKPLQASEVEKKHTYWIEMREGFKQLNDRAINIRATPSQATTYADVIRAAVDYLQSGADMRYPNNAPSTGHLFDILREAWHSLQGPHRKDG